MAGLEAFDDESRIEAVLAKAQELRDIVTNQKNTLRDMQSSSIEDVEISLENEHKSFLKEKKELKDKFLAKTEIIGQKRQVVAGILSEKENIERMYIESLQSYLKRLSETSIFRDALTVYSIENLTKDIDRIRIDGRRVKEHIAVTDRTIGNLISKYNLDFTRSGEILRKNTEIKELRDTDTILIKSKSQLAWCKKSNQFLNRQLEKNSSRNKRDIEFLQSTE